MKIARNPAKWKGKCFFQFAIFWSWKVTSMSGETQQIIQTDSNHSAEMHCPPCDCLVISSAGFVSPVHNHTVFGGLGSHARNHQMMWMNCKHRRRSVYLSSSLITNHMFPDSVLLPGTMDTCFYYTFGQTKALWPDLVHGNYPSSLHLLLNILTPSHSSCNPTSPFPLSPILFLLPFSFLSHTCLNVTDGLSNGGRRWIALRRSHPSRGC